MDADRERFFSEGHVVTGVVTLLRDEAGFTWPCERKGGKKDSGRPA